MKMRWMVLSAVAALCLASLVVTARAQERPSPAPGGIAAGPPDATADDMLTEADRELDGLDLLLAANAGGAPGRGPGEAMGPGGRGGDGRGGPGMRRRPGGPGMSDLHEKLNLSEDQKTRLADIHERRARAAIPIQADLRIAGLDLHKLMRADRPDRQAIDAQIDRIADLRASLQKSRVGSLLEARAVLTPAQQKLMREHHGMGGRGRHGRMDLMDGPMSRHRR